MKSTTAAKNPQSAVVLPFVRPPKAVQPAQNVDTPRAYIEMRPDGELVINQWDDDASRAIDLMYSAMILQARALHSLKNAGRLPN